MNTITTAASQYASRPADERFASVQSLVAAARADKDASATASRNLKDLRAVTENGAVLLGGPKGNPARLTHWSFGQLARMVDAPASYLRQLPADLAAANLNHGLSTAVMGETAQLLLRKGDDGRYTARALTSDTYARLWDADVFSAVSETICHDASWQLPPTWKNDPTTGQPLREGAYRGDRDSFLILVNGGSIVEDPSARGSQQGGAMYRALMISNSEVGARSFTVDTVLYRYICGNHILWGAAFDKRFRRRHVGGITRAALREINRFAFTFAHADTQRDTAIIRAMIDHEIASTREAVLDELQAIGATKAQATAAYDAAEVHEQNPRSYWGAANGLTRISQESGYQDDRFLLDKLGALVLSRAAKLVTA